MNMELVCSILNGIEKSMAEQMVCFSERTFSEVFDVREFKHVWKHKINKLQILRADIFSKASMQDLIEVQNQQN